MGLIGTLQQSRFGWVKVGVLGRGDRVLGSRVSLEVPGRRGLGFAQRLQYPVIKEDTSNLIWVPINLRYIP